MKKKVFFDINGIAQLKTVGFIRFLCKNLIKKELISLGLVLLSLISFTSIKKNLISNVSVIDLTKLPVHENIVNLSHFASKITYLPLENSKDCLIGPGATFYVYDSLIICCAHRQILIFNSKTGIFERSIGEFGKGPKGFVNSWNSYVKDGEIIIVALGWDYPFIEFSTNGDILTKFKLDRNSRNIAWLSDSFYAIYYNKVANYDTLRIQIFDSENKKIITTYYDKRKFKDTPGRTTNFGAFFYHFKNKLYIKEYFNDTVFQVTHNKLIPTIEFISGKYSPPFFDKHKFDFVQYHNIQSIFETDYLVFFQLIFKKRVYFCCFDKRTNRVMIPNHQDSQFNGFENDIDGFMQFYPLSISNRNELIGFLEPFEIRQWFDKNPEKSKMLPPHVQKLRNIQESDNPVLMLVKLK